MTETLEHSPPLPTAERAKAYLDQKAFDDRVDDALETCDFEPTPEVRQGIEGFYQDHYQLAEHIARGLEPIEDDELYAKDNLQKLVSELDAQPAGFTKDILHALVKKRLERLSQPDDSILERDELLLLKYAVEKLFAEPSLGVTTIGEEEVKVIADLHDKVYDKVSQNDQFKQRDGRYEYYVHLGGDRWVTRTVEDGLKDNPAKVIQEAQKKFWEDSRFAGQLLFHNTPYANQVHTEGALLTRRMQMARHGDVRTVNAKTLDGSHHSPTVHWSEQFDEKGLRNGGIEGNKFGTTIAVPLWKIIEAAPYARDANYGVLHLKPGRDKEVVPKVTIKDDTSSFGAGVMDVQGKGGLDRTFYSSPNDVAPDAPLDTAPDGYKIDIDQDSFIVSLTPAERDAYQASGEGFPTRYLIDITGYDTEIKALRDTTYDDEKWKQMFKKRKDALDKAISELQHGSIRQNPNAVVVAMRTGVMDFYVPDDGDSKGKEPARFSSI